MSTEVINIKLVETDSEFLEKTATKITTQGEDWHYLPFWFKRIDGNTFQIYPFEKLPDYMVKCIEMMRNPPEGTITSKI